MYVLMSS